MIPLETERLILRHPQWSDANAIVELIGNFNVSKTLSRVPYPYSGEDAKTWLAGRLDVESPPADHVFALQLKDGPTHLIGVVGVHAERDGSVFDGTKAEIGYWLGEPWWGQRLMSEASRAVVGHCFEVLGLEELVAGYLDGNEGSKRILEGLGFRGCGTKKRESLALGKEVDCAMLRLMHEDWTR
jgi:RimJ/RimL family protein N-acetyltransferase